MAIQEKKRSEIEDIYKWDLTPIYKNEEEFLKEYEEMKKEIKKIEIYNNHLLDNAETLYKALELDSDISRKMEKLYTYAHLNYDSETNNTKELALETTKEALAKTVYSPKIVVASQEELGEVVEV